MKTKPINPLPGVFVRASLQSVRVTPAAFNRWPWSGLAFPCKGNLSRSAVFSFERESMDLHGDDIPETIQGDAACALADDCKALCLFHQSFINPEEGATLLRILSGNETRATRKAWETFIADVQTMEAKRGADAAEWIAMQSWGGRVSSPRDARASARAFLKAYEDGSPSIFDSLPDWREGDCLLSDALILDGFSSYSQRRERARDALETLGFREELERRAEDLDETRREVWESSFWDTLCKSAAGMEEGEESA